MLNSVWHLVRDQGAGGSNPLSPTNQNLSVPETYYFRLAVNRGAIGIASYKPT